MCCKGLAVTKDCFVKLFNEQTRECHCERMRCAGVVERSNLAQAADVCSMNEAIVEHEGLLWPTAHTPPIGLAMTRQETGVAQHINYGSTLCL